MIKDLLFVFWFFLPAGLANIAAFFSGKIPFLKRFSYPVDFNATFRGKRILGSNKTIRGFTFAILAGILTVYLQILLFKNLNFLNTFITLNYEQINPIILGSLAGFGALFGDSVKSFFKRQLGIMPGRSWFPFDQIDYIVGGILLTSLYVQLSLSEYIVLFSIWFFLHLLINFIGYILKLKDSPL